ncbi:MAG: serine/threonine protein kinase, partial [Planctomycetes bacterium]|nr:serine/threonine protein kinase [Planctomycetota bacterium]
MGENGEMKRMGKFELLELLEEGLVGALYRARDTEEDRDVLLKVISPTVSQNPFFGKQLYDKWTDQKSLVEHPNVLRVWEVGEQAGRYYLAAEAVQGQTLSAKLDESPLGIEEALSIVRQIAEGLRAIHRRGVVHGQLTPADVLLTQDKMGRLLVKIAIFDLGVSATGSAISVFGELTGAPKYMAPEVIRGRAPGAQSDIFALGVLAYELFTGREPFPSEHPTGYLFGNCEKEATPADQVNEKAPHEVALVIHRMLEKSPSDRYRAVERVVDDLDRCTECIRTGRAEVVPYGTDSAFARNYELPEPETKLKQPERTRIGHVAIFLILLGLVVGLAVHPIRNNRTEPGRGVAPKTIETTGNETRPAGPARITPPPS